VPATGRPVVPERFPRETHWARNERGGETMFTDLGHLAVMFLKEAPDGKAMAAAFRPGARRSATQLPGSTGPRPRCRPRRHEEAQGG